MDIKYMLACIFMSMGPAKHEQVAIFRRKMSGLRMFSSILGVRSTEKSTKVSFVGQLNLMMPGSKGHDFHACMNNHDSLTP